MNIFNRLKTLPNHICFIIDGNGRWAKKRGLPRMAGHRAGLDNLKKVLEMVKVLKIKIVSVFAFSSENWNRPKAEVDGLMNLFREMLSENNEQYVKDGVCIKIFGDLDGLPSDIKQKSLYLMEKTENCTSQFLNLCINYGGKTEILNAVNNILNDKLQYIDDKIFKKYLYTKDMPDPDFIIRTSGEYRTSNFMPYQSIYSEWYFPKVYWPSFGKKDLFIALKNYENRDRRYGRIKEKV